MISAKENALRLYSHTMPEYLPIMGQGILNNTPVRGYAERADIKPGEEGLDWFGTKWALKIGEPASMSMPDYVLEDIEDWKDLVFPDLDAWDWQKAAELDRIPQFDYENNLLYQMIHNGIFERMHALMGFEDALCALITQPEDVKAYAYAIANYKCKLIDRIAEHYRPDILCYHDDWGTQRGLFFSASVWRDLFKEPTKQIVEHTQRKGIKFELHSDGNIQELIPEIVDDLKVDSLNIQKLNNVPKLKKELGKHKVVYNVFLDTQTLDALHASGELPEDKLRRYLREEMCELGEGGDYIPAMILVRPEWQPIILEEYEKVKNMYA